VLDCFLNPYKEKKDHYVKVFTHLMLQGQVCSAVQFTTDRVHGGGILTLDAPTGVPRHSVLDILLKNIPIRELLMCHPMYPAMFFLL